MGEPGRDRARALRRQGAGLPTPLATPAPERLDVPAHLRAAVRSAHDAALEDGADGYLDPATGAYCFTAGYHWAKGDCCELGCRHCPWVDADRRLAQDPGPGGGPGSP